MDGKKVFVLFATIAISVSSAVCRMWKVSKRPVVVWLLDYASLGLLMMVFDVSVGGCWSVSCKING